MHRLLLLTFFFTFSAMITDAETKIAANGSLYTANDVAENDSSVDDSAVPLWMEVYSEGIYEKDKTPNAMLFVNLGKRLPLPGAIDIYGKCKINTGDQKYYWNNRADLGLGMRGTIGSKVSITGFAEYLAGYYMQTSNVQNRINRMYDQIDSIDYVMNSLNNIVIKSHFGLEQNMDSLFALIDSSLVHTRDSLRNVLREAEESPNGIISEVRGGLTIWKGWGQEYSGYSPLHVWGNIYSELVGSILKKKVMSDLDSTRKDVLIMNTVLYVNPEIGISTKQTVVGSLILSLGVDYWLDAMGDQENNRLLTGAILHYIPFKSLSLDINAGYFAGIYFNRQPDDELPPNDGIFTTFRAGFSFWYGLGT